MKVSTRGRYALRFMLELAMHPPEEYLAIKTIAKRQGISSKYLEQIIPGLNRAGLIKSSRGAQGGYKLAKTPEEITVGSVLRLMEGELLPVPCLQDSPNKCPRCMECITLDLWTKLDVAIRSVVDHITLADMVGDNKAVPPC